MSNHLPASIVNPRVPRGDGTPTVQTETEVAPWRRRLYLPAYRVAEAGRYAEVHPQTVSRWHLGNARTTAALPGRGKGNDLSYYQLVEVAFVATFRKLGVSLQRIRKARDYAAQVLKSEYPFAEHSWLTEGHHVLLELPETVGQAFANNLVVADANGQIGWKDVIGDRFHQFEYEDETALVWHLRGRENPVSIDPRISFGAPTVKGIPTWALKGRWDAGERITEIQDDFGLDEYDVRHGLQFEGVDFKISREIA